MTTATSMVPLTDTQQGLLIIDRMVRTAHLYNTVTRFDLRPVGDDRLRTALSDLVTVQPSLRMLVFDAPMVHGILDAPPAEADLPLEVVTGGGSHEDTVAAVTTRLGGHGFTLVGEPLYRFAVVRTGEQCTLVLLAHHLVFDGFSLQPLARDLARLLTARPSGAELAALRERRERALQSELGAQDRIANDPQTRQQADELADRLRPLDAGQLYPRPHRPAETPFAGRRTGWRLDDETTAALQDTCRRLGVSPFTLLTAVYGAVLARHTGAGAALIGSPFLARRTVGALDLCGFFVNTLPIGFEVDWEHTFDEYVRAVVAPAVEFTRARSATPFSTLVQRLRPDRSTNRNPVFSCMIVMQDGAQGVGDAIGRTVELGNDTAKFDLWLGVSNNADGWVLEIEHDLELVPVPIAEDVITSLRTALQRALTRPGAGLRDLFDDESLAASSVTDGYRGEPPVPSLTGWLDRTAAERPAAVAVSDRHGQTSYADLQAAVLATAGGLRARGVGPGSVVGLHLDTLRDTVVGMLAIVRCGAAYLPLDPDLPAARLEFMVRRAGCGLVVGGLQVPGCGSVALEDLTGDPAPQAAAGTPDTVYVMFSSGSTGEPKGIAMGEPPLLNLTAWQVEALGMGPDTRFLQYAPLGFDVSFQEIVPTLVAGGTVVSREPVDRRDFPALAARVRDTAVTHVYLPVAALRAFVQAADDDGITFPDLRHLCVSGEQLLLDDQVHAFFDRHPSCTLVNLYGPTETHAVTTHRLGTGDRHWPVHAPIGLPLDGVAAYVVDTTGHLAPRGVTGELLLGGRCPAHGYVNAPELTAERFVPDRFAGAGTMYRTGDRVLRDEHGVLLFLGRDDEQVKIRGYRVELGELEATANAVGGVRQAVAAARDTPAGRELVLFFVAGEDPARTAADLGRRLREALPGYMVPARIEAVAHVPRTANGKFDRPALIAALRAAAPAGPAQPAGQSDSAALDGAGYRDELERELGAMWTRLIGQPGIAPDRSLLECGAHSLTVFAGLGEVRRRYGFAMPIAEFFKEPTIERLARAIRAGRGGQ